MKHILVIKLRYIGDVVLTTPVLRVLRTQFPQAKIVCLVNLGTQEVISHNPHVDEVLVLKRGRLREQVQFFLDLRSRKFDCVIDLTDGDRSAVLSTISGAPKRIGFNSEKRWRGWLYTDCVGSDYGSRHMVEHHAQALRSIGVKDLVGNPEVYVAQEHDQTAQTVIAQLGLEPRRWVMIHLTARYWFKTWPLERFALLSDRLAEKNLSVVLVGHVQDQEVSEKMQACTNAPVISLVGKTNLLELAALMKYSDLFVGNDTGVMHIAAATGCPVLGLFGPTDPRVWGPRGETTKVLYKGLDCRACFHPGCFRGEDNCMKQISVDEVYSAALELLF